MQFHIQRQTMVKPLLGEVLANELDNVTSYGNP